MDIEQIIQGLQSQGMQPDQILDALKQMLQEGKITQEDLDKAMQILQGGGEPADPEAEERAKASELLGVQL